MISKPEKQADDLLKDFDLSFPISIKEVCEVFSANSYQIIYQEQSFTNNIICGMTIGNTTQAQIFINAGISESRRRFTAAHEVGHVVLHVQPGTRLKFECSSNDLRENKNQEKIYEVEANQFASALLMPRDRLEKKLKQYDLTWQLIQEISQECQTSLEATARRLVSLSKELYALIVHKDGRLYYPIKSNSFTPSIPFSPFSKNLDSVILEGQSQSIQDLPAKLEECDLSDWGLEQSTFKYSCYYSSLFLEKYNYRMTLLYLEENEEDESEDYF